MVQLASEAMVPTRAVKLIVLDRDGVINHDSDQFIKSPEEWRPIPGSLEAIARLNHAGYRVVVATNQSGVGRGLLDITMLNAIHERMHKALASAKPAVDRFFDDVMVMAEDEALRANRLALLNRVAATMNRVADISKLAA